MGLSKRQSYLQNVWAGYVGFVASSVEWGRVVSVSGLPLGTISIQSYRPEVYFQNLIVDVVLPLEGENWREILLVGDIVSINQRKEISLLVPNISGQELSSPISQRKWQVLQLWAEYLRLVRGFFSENQFQEISTPLLVEHPGSEPTLEPFKTVLKSGKELRSKYLPTSPELQLKKILTSGVPRVFEITKSFRNNEDTERHCPEFWILEWYRNFSDLKQIKSDVKELIIYLQKHFDIYLEKNPWLELKLDSQSVFSEKSFSDIFKSKYQYEFNPDTSYESLKLFCQKENVEFLGIDNIEDLFSLVTLEKIESCLNSQEITFLENYPPYAAALARKSEQGWAERFEVYWKGLELANAFYELNDPVEQKTRFLQDNELKRRHGLEELPLDEDFLLKLQWGMPPCSGIALGLERLFMALFDIQNIRELKT